MRRRLLRLLSILAALAIAGVVWILATLPPATVHPTDRVRPANRVSGAYHIHSNRSDGSGSVDKIAEAATDSDVDFVIITDHGDGTRTPDPPVYRYGVLCIDAVEVSSSGGHVVALNLGQAAPYPLGGETRDVIDDIHRLGGWAVAAHPDSPKPDLRWRGRAAAYDGLEWFNADSAWRTRPHGLPGILARSLFRPPEAIASLFETPAQTLSRWDNALRERPVFALAAVDAHARLGTDNDPGTTGGGISMRYPGYETMFRTVAQTVALAQPPTGDAAADAAALLAAIGAGRSFSVVRAFIDDPAALEFTASTSTERVEYGGTITQTGSVVIQARVPEGTGATLKLLANGREAVAGRDRIEFTATEPAAYRVEAYLDGRAMPWIVSNAIRVALPSQPIPAPATAPKGLPPLAFAPDCWVVEKSSSSSAEIHTAGQDVRVNYRLGAGAPSGQYIAIACGASGSTPIERIEFTASSPKPMRLSVQARMTGGAGVQRWGRSVYVDSETPQISVPLSEFEALDRPSTMRPISARVQSVLFVVDTVNARPGTAGEFVLKNVSFVPGGGQPQQR